MCMLYTHQNCANKKKMTEILCSVSTKEKSILNEDLRVEMAGIRNLKLRALGVCLDKDS